MNSFKSRNSPHLNLAKKYWKALLSPRDLVVDATCGNGQDTLYLSHLVPEGIVFSFDIQQEALSNAELLLKSHLPPEQLQRVFLVLQSHAKWEAISFPFPPKLIVYNLGYLPGGDKQITTKTVTTLESIKKGLSLLDSKGALSITCYPGHPEGALEEKEILDFFSSLPFKDWMICHHRFINRSNAPSLFWVSKNFITNQ